MAATSTATGERQACSGALVLGVGLGRNSNCCTLRRSSLRPPDSQRRLRQARPRSLDLLAGAELELQVIGLEVAQPGATHALGLHPRQLRQQQQRAARVASRLTPAASMSRAVSPKASRAHSRCERAGS